MNKKLILAVLAVPILGITVAAVIRSKSPVPGDFRDALTEKLRESMNFTEFDTRIPVPRNTGKNPAPAKAEKLESAPRQIDRFQARDEGKFPSNWRSVQGKAGIYSIQVESGNAYLAARADQAAGMILTEVRADPGDYSLLRWRWLVRKLPAGADETGNDGKNDCAASVYVVFDRGLTDYTKHTIRYVWSAYPHEKGMTLKVRGNVFYVIRENRNSPLDRWVEEEVNFAGDYRKLFKKEPPPIAAIGIQSDSDDTGTASWADYDDFFLLK